MSGFEREFGEVQAELRNLHRGQEEIKDLLVEQHVATHERIAKHDRRLRSLETWRALATGVVAAISGLFGIHYTQR